VNWLVLDTEFPLADGESKEVMAPLGAVETVAVPFKAVSVAAAPADERE
jgi:hypothetical protein